MGFLARITVPLLAALAFASLAVVGSASPQSAYPTEAQTRNYAFTLTWEQGSPDGVQRNMFKINGGFPGPKLELNEGDEVIVKVENASPYNTTIHYHGAS